MVKRLTTDNCERCGQEITDWKVSPFICSACCRAYEILTEDPSEGLLIAQGLAAIAVMLASYGVAIWQAFVGNWWPLLVIALYLVARSYGDAWAKTAEALRNHARKGACAETGKPEPPMGRTFNAGRPPKEHPPE